MMKWQLRDCKENKLSELRKEIVLGGATVKEYHFVCCTSSAHSGHPTGKVSGYSQCAHLLIIAKITRLVASGITNVHEVHVKFFGIMYSMTYRLFNPVSTDRANAV